MLFPVDKADYPDFREDVFSRICKNMNIEKSDPSDEILQKIRCRKSLIIEGQNLKLDNLRDFFQFVSLRLEVSDSYVKPLNRADFEKACLNDFIEPIKLSTE